MSKLYVFGIGGTGASVLRSLTHLMAAGVTCRDTIVPVLIDPDINNGDLTRTISLLQRYVVIRNLLRYDSMSERGEAPHIRNMNSVSQMEAPVQIETMTRNRPKTAKKML